MRRLLPKDPEIGRLPYAWLAFLGFFFVKFYFVDVPSWEIALSAAGILVFLIAYFAAFWMRSGTKRLLWPVAIFAALGFGFSAINQGANVFFTYAAFFAGWAVRPRWAMAITASLCMLIALASALYDLPAMYWIVGLIVTSALGAMGNHFSGVEDLHAKLRRNQTEIEHLATVAERERIARDLHDMLGHTLSVITLKAELADRQWDVDSDGARREIREIHDVARGMLGKVRETVHGYRPLGLRAEIDAVSRLLSSLEIRVDTEVAPGDLPPRHEAALGMVLREAVTNIIRHADSAVCRLRLTVDDGSATLEIDDDGVGGQHAEGHGLRGMRERIEALEGRLDVNGDRGTRILAMLPLPQSP